MTEDSPKPDMPPSASDGKQMLKLFGPHLALFALALIVGLGGVLYALQRPRKEAPACPAASIAATARLAPLAKGEVAAFRVETKPRWMPDLAFEGPDGKPARLSQHRGKTLLVNLWATWCPPCRKEMPSLDRLEAAMGGAAFEVLPISLDTSHLERRQAFLDQIGARHLKLRGDPQGTILPIMKADSGVLGLPTTVLVDPAGCALGMLQGPAEWDSPDARALVAAALGK